MAVISIDQQNNFISILVEKRDCIRFKNENTTNICYGNKYLIGEVITNDSSKIIMIRGDNNG